MNVERERTDRSEPTEIESYGSIARGRGDQMQVALREYGGGPKLDVRVFEQRKCGSAMTMRATGRGITVRPADIPALLGLLKKAEQDAKERGLI